VIERLWTDGHHYRCYPGKATSRYIITAKRGIELIDMTGEDHSRNNWVRATCRVGFTPCNGLLYAPPHSCGCYMNAKLFGFWALAGQRAPADMEAKSPPQRLHEGPAYREVRAQTSEVRDGVSGESGRKLPEASSNPRSAFRIPRSTGWWTYRGGSARGASTAVKVPADLTQAWRTELGGRLSAATVADGKVFVAQVDSHTVHALDLNTGEKRWSFTAGGRVDSPPTCAGGLVLFGSRDGHLYCLRASDGKLVWRFLAAPRRLNAVALEQPESVWPVHGSVLFHGGVVYAAAGRSSYLDGGIMLYGLDPRSGQVVAKRRIQSEHVGAVEPPADADQYATKIRQNWLDYKTKLAADQSDSFAMRGATTDILTADKESIYLRNMRFDRSLVDLDTNRPHLFSTSALLDGWEHNRSYWVLGTGDFYNLPVAYPWILRKDIRVPFGLMLAFDEKTVWAVRRGKGYTLVAAPRPDPAPPESGFPDFQARSSTGKTSDPLWTASLGIRPRAMLRAGELLFLGGLPIAPSGDSRSPATAEPAAANRGHLHVVSCGDGKTVRDIQIASPPVWDGMAAVEGMLVVPCTNGSVVCLAAR
jgi:hypothetical protein